jgi:hypothetical protein
LSGRDAGKEQEQNDEDEEREEQSGREVELPLKYPWHRGPPL